MGLHTLPAQSITTGTSVTTTVKAINSAVGDSVVVTPRTPDASFNTVVWHAWVSAADTVTIKFSNPVPVQRTLSRKRSTFASSRTPKEESDGQAHSTWPHRQS